MSIAPSVRALLAILALAAAVGAVLRLALGFEFLPTGGWPWPMPWLLVRGAFADVAAWSVLLAVPAALACFSSAPQWNLRLARFVLAVLGGALAFLAVIELYFAEEFSARFNHIAVDYLLYPTEVAKNMWQGYPVVVWLVACALFGTLLAWPMTRFVARPASRSKFDVRARALQALGCILVGALGLAWSRSEPLGHHGDRLEREIAGNGLVGFTRAILTAHLDYATYYATLPPDRAALLFEDARGPKRTGNPLPVRPQQVVVVLEESFGQEFVGSLGGKRDCTPQFDRWSERGLLFTNLYATGNRTVRGLEGTLASFPPLPPDSIVKRPGLAGFPTLASVFREAGYTTAFFYGGVASFDNMGTWMSSNGWDEIVDDGWIGPSPYPDDAFRTAWGVADGPALDLLLERQVAQHNAGQPFFATALTVSNHKPFLVPEPFGKPAKLSTRKLVRLVGIGLVAMLVLASLWWRCRNVLGIPALAVLSMLVALGYSMLLKLEATAKGGRTDGVRYADSALGSYLDGLETHGLLDATLVLVVGDHGARVYGSADIPVASYRVPALFLGAGVEPNGRNERLCSQIDLAPTLLDLCSLPIPEGFFGASQLGLPAAGGRALVQHNRDIALFDDTHCVALGLQRTVSVYERRGPEFVPLEGRDPSIEHMVERCQAIFQVAWGRLQGHLDSQADAAGGSGLR